MILSLRCGTVACRQLRWLAFLSILLAAIPVARVDAQEFDAGGSASEHDEDVDAANSAADEDPGAVSTGPLPRRPLTPQRRDPPRGITRISEDEFGLAIYVLLFGVVVVLVEGFLVLRSVPSPRAIDITRMLVVTLVILGSLFVVAGGYSAQDVAPIIGLFGTIAGYLLGRQSGTAPSDQGQGPPGPQGQGMSTPQGAHVQVQPGQPAQGQVQPAAQGALQPPSQPSPPGQPAQAEVPPTYDEQQTQPPVQPQPQAPTQVAATPQNESQGAE